MVDTFCLGLKDTFAHGFVGWEEYVLLRGKLNTGSSWKILTMKTHAAHNLAQSILRANWASSHMPILLNQTW